MKKSSWFFLNAGLVAAFVLAACSPAATATAVPTAVPAATTVPTEAMAPVELTLWNAYSAGGSEEAVLNKLVGTYTAGHPNVTVNVQNIPFDQIFNKWQTDVSSGGTAADMFTAPNDDLGNWVRAGTVAPLDDLLAGKLGGVSDTGVAGVTVDGQIYAVPGIIKAVALYYNKSTVPPRPPPPMSCCRWSRTARSW